MTGRNEKIELFLYLMFWLKMKLISAPICNSYLQQEVQIYPNFDFIINWINVSFHLSNFLLLFFGFQLLLASCFSSLTSLFTIIASKLIITFLGVVHPRLILSLGISLTREDQSILILIFFIFLRVFITILVFNVYILLPFVFRWGIGKFWFFLADFILFTRCFLYDRFSLLSGS